MLLRYYEQFHLYERCLKRYGTTLLQVTCFFYNRKGALFLKVLRRAKVVFTHVTRGQVIPSFCCTKMDIISFCLGPPIWIAVYTISENAETRKKYPKGKSV